MNHQTIFGRPSRRDVLRGLAACAAAPALRAQTSVKQASFKQASAHIEVITGEPIGTIAPEIYGHFTEHLGGVIYDLSLIHIYILSQLHILHGRLCGHGKAG